MKVKPFTARISPKNDARIDAVAGRHRRAKLFREAATPALAQPLHHYEESDALGWVETYPLSKGSEKTGVMCIGACGADAGKTWTCAGISPANRCAIDCGDHVTQNSPIPKTGCVGSEAIRSTPAH